MRIAILSSGKKPIPSPPDSIYAPGVIMGHLADNLTVRGHEVTLFADKDSQTKANLISLGLPSSYRAYSHLKKTNLADYYNYEVQNELSLISYCCELARKGDFDLIHAHDFRKVQYFANLVNIPIVFTYHGNVFDDTKEKIDRQRFLRFKDRVYFIATTDQQVNDASKHLNFIGRVYHGVDINQFAYNAHPDEAFLYAGRLIPHKGPDLAIQASKTIGGKLLVVGDIGPTVGDQKFFENLKKAFSSNIQFLGHIHFAKMPKLYQQVKALLMPNRSAEAFGMVVIEAMACGTPVIAFDVGPMRELIKDGVTGFVVERGNLVALQEAMKKIDQIDRNACRRHVEENFTVEKMIDGYEEIYKKIIADWKKNEI